MIDAFLLSAKQYLPTEKLETKQEVRDQKRVKDRKKEGKRAPRYNYKNRETECKYLLEKLLKVPFEKARPEFMRNPKTKRKLELDLYNQELRIALEYQGPHHSHYSEHFHKTREKFEKLRERDALKKQLASQAGVFLIVVHYHIPDIRLEEYLLKAIDVWKKNVGKT